MGTELMLESEADKQHGLPQLIGTKVLVYSVGRLDGEVGRYRRSCFRVSLLIFPDGVFNSLNLYPLTGPKDILKSLNWFFETLLQSRKNMPSGL